MSPCADAMETAPKRRVVRMARTPDERLFMSGETGIVISGCRVATVDDRDTEHADGYVAFTGGRIADVGAGRPPARFDDWTRMDGTGLLLTPGPVNTHHHLDPWT